MSGQTSDVTSLDPRQRNGTGAATTSGQETGQRKSHEDPEGAMKFIVVTLCVYALMGILSLLLVRIVRRAKFSKHRRNADHPEESNSVRCYIRQRHQLRMQAHRQKLMHEKTKTAMALWDTHIPLLSRPHLITSRQAHLITKDAHLPNSDAHTTNSDAHHPNSDAHLVTSDVHPATCDVHPNTRDAFTPNSDAHLVTSDAHPLTSDTRLVTSETHPPIRDTNPITSNAHPITSDAYTPTRGANSPNSADDAHPVTNDAHQ